MTLFQKIRTKKVYRIVAAYLALSLLGQIFSPSLALALTNGPSQPEVQSFEPVGTTDMVDLFTGDFNYNIPLFELPGPNGGYPFNLSYHSGVGMDQEASWVGLGWNLNPGAIIRGMRGLPDDFNGQTVTRKLDRKNMVTFGVGYSFDHELAGADSKKLLAGNYLGATFRIYYNSYRGIGYSLGSGTPHEHKIVGNRIGLNFSLDSQEGIGVEPFASVQSRIKNTHLEFGVGGKFSSRSGLTLSANMGFVRRTSGEHAGTIYTGKAFGMQGTSSYSFAHVAYLPVTAAASRNFDLDISLKYGPGPMVYPNSEFSGFYSIDRLHKNNRTQSGFAYGYNYLHEADKSEKKKGSHSDDLNFNDVNREKDGSLCKTSPNLAIPNLTYDFYNIEGQGIAGSFRPYRSEVGRTFDAPVFSWGAGISAGFEGPLRHLGTDALELSLNFSHTKPWDNDNDWADFYKFLSGSDITDTNINGAVAPELLYYKSLGESTSFPLNEMDYIGGEEAVRATFDKQGSFLAPNYNPVADKLHASHSGNISSGTVENGRINRDRISRNTSIYPISNNALCNSSGTPILKEYDTRYFTAIDTNGNYGTPSQAIDRFSRSGMDIHSHTAGVTAVNPDGNRYVYGLPVYNLSDKEISYSVEAPNDPLDRQSTTVNDNIQPDHTSFTGSENFFSETNISAYTHSFLLTSILGTDYVDVTGDGITDDDYGYWVKFNYVKVYGDDGHNENMGVYKWRAPYIDAAYDPGMLSTGKDDKSHIQTGDREMYYLATAETKTHIAVFQISKREDGLSASYDYAHSKGTNPYYKLDEIRVYTKSEYARLLASATDVKPIKIIKFKYNYDLCGTRVSSKTNNNSGNDKLVDIDGNTVGAGNSADINYNRGKLTLKEIDFNYQDNSRGSLSPYKFDYGERTGSAINQDTDPDYDAYAYDRWGNYRRYSGTPELYAPYVKQFDPATLQTAAEKASFKTTKDEDASAWCLRTITLPTGGKISVSYESDDYAYVQHKKAAQMFQVAHFYDSSNPEALYLQSDWNATNKTKRRIYFNLETPVKIADATPQRFFNDYISGLKQQDGTYQLYYKLLMKVRKDNESPEEFITGYSNLLVSPPDTALSSSPNADYGYNTATTTVDGNSCYTKGFVTVALTDIRNTDANQYHPFAVAAWQFLRTDQPDLLHSLGNVDEAGSAADKVAAVHNLLSFVNDFQQLFQHFRGYCFHQDYGRTVSNLSKCYIRLTTPDEIKFGGGCRVKELKISDEWNAQSGESNSEYGQEYEYTTTDASGNTISSGVASYEPQIGGEETALRCAKHYVDEIPVFTDNDLFFEYPTNESNYPAPLVGYSKVTVKSISTQQILDNTLSENARGTGVVVTEFYTSKDFPVITDETDIDKKPFDLYIPIPFIGQVVTNNMTAAQGYSIILNDMHGKLKSVTNYGLDASGNLMLSAPLSKVEYQYKCTDKVMPDGTVAKQLVNDVPVIYDDGVNSSGELRTDTHSGTNAIVGEEYDFFTDQRQNNNYNVRCGVDFNVEIAGISLPFPWPSISTHTNDVKTVVTNKIIHKSGILMKTIATDAQSVVITENKLFDAQTGRPLLVTVTNNYNYPVYRYDIPAFWNYDNMGAAYKNIGLPFRATIDAANTTLERYTLSTSGILWSVSGSVTLSNDELYNLLTEGDEFILQYDSNNSSSLDPSDAKYHCTLIEHRQYCDANGNPTKSMVFHCPASLVSGRLVSLILVRSGRRNLLGVNSGSIVALNDPTNNTNRTTTTLSSASFTNTTIAAEIADFLQYTLAAGHLNFQTYNLGSGVFYDGDGNALFPALSELYSSIEIRECVGGFEMILSARTPDGSCSQVTCGCYKFDPLKEILSFTAQGASITIDYNDEGHTSDDAFTLNCINLSITPKVTYMTEVLNASAIQFRDFWDYDMSLPDYYSAQVVHNLYAIGKKGIWRPWNDWYYNDGRYKATSSTPGTALATDGVFDGNGTDKHYFFYQWNANVLNPVPEQWVPNNTITRYDQDGNEVENKDILGNFSAARFGYDNTLNVALAANARYNEIFYESSDDPFAIPSLGSGTNGVSSTIAHTGTQSLKVDNAVSNKTLSLSSNFFEPSKKYIISMWVARTGNPQLTYFDATDANSSGVTLTYTNMSGGTLSTSATLKPTGEVIDGWQRIEAEITTPAAASGESFVKIKINFQGGHSGSTDLVSYYDDVRIFPSDGNMVTYVYDPVTYRLAAKMDDNNFATFYYYDEEGALFLVKQETEKGIATIQEARSHKQHQ